MIKFSDYSEIYMASGESSTREWLHAPSNDYLTKLEVIFSSASGRDYISNVSVLADIVPELKRSSVRVANNKTMLSRWSNSEDTLADYSAVRDLIYHWEKHGKGRLASVYAVYFVESNFSKMNLESINSLLSSASPRRLTTWSMVALLRASYSAKHLLPAWVVFFEAVKEELKDNERAPMLLAGLDQ